MGDLVLEKLIQKVSNMLDEIGEVNILVRRMTPTQETLNRINERVDAVFGALSHLEKGVQLDEQKLAQLEEQISLLKEGLGSVNNMAEELVSSFKGTAHEVRKGLDSLDHEEYRRSENNNKVLVDLQKRLVVLRIIGIVIILLAGMVLSFVLFR
jgi:uncharacterized phage infection (PIP) family protein YhgE